MDELKVRNVKVHQVIRTVPYDPTQSQEGLLIAEDGSVIYSDAWMHRDVLEEEESNGRNKK